MKAKHYYECRITIDPVFGADRLDVEAWAAQHKFKLAAFFMDKGVPNQKDTFMTGHSKDLTLLVTDMRELIKELQKDGFNVRRYKIEDIVLDSRISDVLEIL